MPLFGSLLTVIKYFSLLIENTESSVKSLTRHQSSCKLVMNEESHFEPEECEADQVNLTESYDNNNIIELKTKVNSQRMASMYITL